jgi:hypothetical protein
VGGIAFALLIGGYGVAYYGYNRITGGNDKFISLIWPGRYTPTARDDGSGGATSASSTSSTSSATKATAPIAPTKTVTIPGNPVKAQ